MRAMTLRLPDEVHEALRREAFETRRSMNELVLEALTSVSQMRADLNDWETEGAPAWVEAKRQAIREARFQAWDEGKFAERYAATEKRFPDNPYREGSK